MCPVIKGLDYTMKILKYLLIPVVIIATILTISMSGETTISNSYADFWSVDKTYKYQYKMKLDGKGLEHASSSSNKTRSENINALFYVYITPFMDEDYKKAHLIVEKKKDFGSSIGLPRADKRISSIITFAKNSSVKSFIMEKPDYGKYNSIVREIISTINLPKYDKAELLLTEESVAGLTPITLLRSKNYLTSGFSIIKEYKGNNVQGEITYAIDGTLIEMKAQRNRQFYIGKKLVSSDSLEASMELLAIENAHINDVLLSNNTVTDTLSADELNKQLLLKSSKNVLNGQDKLSVEQELAYIEHSNSQESVLVWQKLVALLRLNPDYASELEHLILDHTHLSPQFSIIASALNYVGDDSAQKALVNAFESLSSEAAQETLLPHITFLKTPNENSIQLIKSLKNSANNTLKNRASLGLGTMANNLKQSRPDIADDVFSDIVTDLNNSSSGREVRHQLNVIGNTGNKELIQEIAGHLDSTDAGIYEAAIYSLRFVDTDESRSILYKLINENQDDKRRVAVNALGFHSPDANSLELYKRLLKNETDKAILKSVISNTGKMIKEYPPAQNVIEDFISTCGVLQLCNFAKNVVSSNRLQDLN